MNKISEQNKIKIQDKIQKEYDVFYNSIISKRKEEIYNSHYKIHFMNEITEMILNSDCLFDYISEEKLLWFLKTSNALEVLYSNYLDTELYIGSWDKNVEIIEELIS